MTRALALAGALILAAGLAGCGKVGQLDRPGPLFGGNRAASGAAGAADSAEAQRPQDPSRPVDTVDPRDRTRDTAPPRTVPIPGANQGPSQMPPQGALADPYARPPR